MTPWPHQTYGIEQYRIARTSGYRRIAITGPTGSGKGYMIEQAIKLARSATLYTDRKALLEQTAKRLTEAEIHFGIRAADYTPDHFAPVQLCMVQTEDSRVIRNQKRDHHRCELVVVDECHRIGGVGIQELIERHMADDSTLLGFTATPLGLGGTFDKLITAASVSDCRKCGALVPALTFAPDEPDLRGINQASSGEFEVGPLARLYKRPVVFGRVLDNWKRLNPEHKPTILFAPDVDGARWFCEQLNVEGIPAGHIDGEQIIIGDEVLEPTAENRQRLHDSLKSGEIKIVTNRYVMREGIDWPWVECAIFATAFGTITSYLQSGGRVLRASPGKTHAIIIDHGGNYHRHGSLNSDRIWELHKTDVQMQRERAEKMRSKEDDSITEPVVCPKCSKVQLEPGRKCSNCGFMAKGRTRMVIQADGNLREVTGDIYKPRKVSEDPADEKVWKQCYFRCKRSGQTFSQAIGLFKQETGKWPDDRWPLMPKESGDKQRKVRDVPMSALVPSDPKQEARRPEPEQTASLFSGKA